MKPKVYLLIGEYTDARTHARGIRVGVKNIGDSPIKQLKVEWSYEFETPQPVAGGRGTRPAVSEIGRSFAFFTAAPDEFQPLDPGVTCCFYLPVELTDQVKSVAASLSPECYSIQVTIDGEKRTGIAGSDLGDFVQRHFPS